MNLFNALTDDEIQAINTEVYNAFEVARRIGKYIWDTRNNVGGPDVLRPVSDFTAGQHAPGIYGLIPITVAKCVDQDMPIGEFAFNCAEAYQLWARESRKTGVTLNRKMFAICVRDALFANNTAGWTKYQTDLQKLGFTI